MQATENWTPAREKRTSYECPRSGVEESLRIDPMKGFVKKSNMEGKDVRLDSAQLLVEVGVRLWARIAPY